jgi:hypothetical protein
MYFISAADILLPSLALIVQFKHAGSEAKGSNPTTGLTLLWPRNPFRGKFKHWQVSQEKIIQHEMCALLYSIFFPETFFILGRIQQDIIINVLKSSCKVPFILVRFYRKFDFV